jgi:hypothetical protein
MPETFPVADPNTGELVDTPHYSIDELAAMLHVHATTANRLMRRERWPHFTVNRRAWFSPSDVLAVVASMRRNDEPDVPEGPPPTLGLVVPDDDAPEGDADPGGIR